MNKHWSAIRNFCWKYTRHLFVSGIVLLIIGVICVLSTVKRVNEKHITQECVTNYESAGWSELHESNPVDLVLKKFKFGQALYRINGDRSGDLWGTPEHYVVNFYVEHYIDSVFTQDLPRTIDLGPADIQLSMCGKGKSTRVFYKLVVHEPAAPVVCDDTQTALDYKGLQSAFGTMSPDKYTLSETEGTVSLLTSESGKNYCVTNSALKVILLIVRVDPDLQLSTNTVHEIGLDRIHQGMYRDVEGNWIKLPAEYHEGISGTIHFRGEDINLDSYTAPGGSNDTAVVTEFYKWSYHYEETGHEQPRYWWDDPLEMCIYMGLHEYLLPIEDPVVKSLCSVQP